MNDFTIYRNYGVLGAEKRNVYTYGAPRLYALDKDQKAHRVELIIIEEK